MANLIKDAKEKEVVITFSDITELVRMQGTVQIVKIKDSSQLYGIAQKRIDQSECNDDTELYLTVRGAKNWLTPADTVTAYDNDDTKTW